MDEATAVGLRKTKLYDTSERAGERGIRGTVERVHKFKRIGLLRPTVV